MPAKTRECVVIRIVQRAIERSEGADCASHAWMDVRECATGDDEHCAGGEGRLFDTCAGDSFSAARPVGTRRMKLCSFQ